MFFFVFLCKVSQNQSLTDLVITNRRAQGSAQCVMWAKLMHDFGKWWLQMHLADFGVNQNNGILVAEAIPDLIYLEMVNLKQSKQEISVPAQQDKILREEYLLTVTQPLMYTRLQLHFVHFISSNCYSHKVPCSMSIHFIICRPLFIREIRSIWSRVLKLQI